MKTIKNPILRGFNPDPSIIRVGQDYYIATSTFEWFPGVQIHHSRDLKNWKLVTRPLNRLSQLDMKGVPDSCGVWAPCLSYHEGTFYLVYSNVRTFDGIWKDTPNFLVTTRDIPGDWSEPVFLSSGGFDGSLFHDEDGRKWYSSLLVDHRKGKFFGGITLQEYDPELKKLTGKTHLIFKGSTLGLTEGPHLYKKDGYYYLATAEGGTEYGHAMTLARSKSLTGPYELHPQHPFISARDAPDNALQKAGHGDLLRLHNGAWYVVFLTGTPLTPRGRCTLGRETSIEKVVWKEEGWPSLSHGNRVPRTEVEAPDFPEYTFEEAPARDDFEGERLSIHLQSLRIPVSEDWASLRARKGYLRLVGKESLSSFHCQSLLARRVQEYHIQAGTCVEFEPRTFQQMAGLVCYYNTSHFHYLCLTGKEDGSGKYLNLLTCDKFKMTEPLAEPREVTGVKRLFLKVDFHREKIQFYYAVEENQWQTIGPVLDGSILSDDYVRDEQNRYRPAFTGAFVGICCQDLSGQKQHADFDWLDYQELNQ